MARSPLRDGWRVLMRAPAVLLTEIVWRWTFGVAFWAILYYSFREYFASVEISNGEYALMRSFAPDTWIIVMARVLVAFGMGLRALGPIIVPAIIILWVALAAIGRAATVRALAADEPRTNWPSTVGLHLFRVLLIFACVLAYFGSGILIGNLVGNSTEHMGIVILLSTLSLVAIVFIWSIVNWFFSLAAIFTSRDHAGFAASLGETSALYRRHTDSFFSSGFWFGLIRTFLAIAVTIVSLAAIGRLGAAHLRFTFAFVTALTLVYFAIADAVNLWRLATYISFTEPEPETPLVVVSAPPPFEPVIVPGTEPMPTDSAVADPTATPIASDDPATNSQ